MIALSILVYVEALSTGAIRSTSIRHKPLRPARPCATCPRVAVNYPQMNSPLRIAVRSTEHQFKEGLVATPAVAFFGLGRPRVIIVLSLLALVSAVLVVARRKSGGVAPTEVYDDERAPPAAPTPSAPPAVPSVAPPAPAAAQSTAWTEQALKRVDMQKAKAAAKAAPPPPPPPPPP